MFEINLECFLSKEITIKLWKDLFILEQPTVKQLANIIKKTESRWQDEVKNTKIMIEVLQSFLKNKWWFGYTKAKLGYILKHLTPENLVLVRNEIFFWLGLTKEPLRELESDLTKQQASSPW